MFPIAMGKEAVEVEEDETAYKQIVVSDSNAQVVELTNTVEEQIAHQIDTSRKRDAKA